MDSDTPNLLLHLKQLSKPISSDLLTNLLYMLDAVCVCVWCADQIILMFIGVYIGEYGFLCVYNVM